MFVFGDAVGISQYPLNTFATISIQQNYLTVSDTPFRGAIFSSNATMGQFEGYKYLLYSLINIQVYFACCCSARLRYLHFISYITFFV
jgi:hypothetical protein